jgi:hypothetical protein
VVGGQRIIDLAPNLFAMVPKRKVDRRTVCESPYTPNKSKLDPDIQGTTTVAELAQYWELSDILTGVELQQGVHDSTQVNQPM